MSRVAPGWLTRGYSGPHMLLTLSARSFRSRLVGSGRKKPELSLVDLPRYARDHLDLYGMTVQTEFLAGADIARLEAIRDAADKAQCPCLVLVDSETCEMAALDDGPGDVAMARVTRVVQAASRLGCNSVAVSITGSADEEAVEYAVERFRRVLATADRLEINVLITLGGGPTATPDALTDLIKRIGGFRIGTYPDFETAARADDPAAFLKRMVPYASALCASSVSFEEQSGHTPPVHTAYDLPMMVRTVRSIGYSGTLAIEYRGEGDPEQGVVYTREILADAMTVEA